jgi:hypothetical protein
MRRTALFSTGLFVAASLVTLPAMADPTAPAAPAPAPVVHTLPTIVITGRPQKPAVVIIVQRASAVVEAGAAHQAFRESLVARSEPR